MTDRLGPTLPPVRTIERFLVEEGSIYPVFTDPSSDVDQNVTCDTTYYYRVRGTNDAGNGSFTTPVQIMPSSGGGA